MKHYETLALEPELSKKAKDFARETIKKFAGSELFIRRIISYKPLIDGLPEQQNKETELALTVDGVLKDFQTVQSDYMDITLSKEHTNASTSDVVTLNGNDFLPALPAPALLNLESRLEEIRSFYMDIPTLDPTAKWEIDAEAAERVYKSGPYKKHQYQKVRRTQVLYEATKEHPAQTEPYTEDVPAYEVSETVWNAKFTPAEKQERIERIEQLIREVKSARMRANDVEAVRVKVADKIFAFINEGKV